MPTLLPRLNVTVTREQHALLLELASLDPDTPSAAAFIRQLIDQVTPLLRVTVPAMRRAAEEQLGAANSLHMPLRAALKRANEAVDQLELLGHDALAGALVPSESEGERPKKRRARR